MERRSGPAGDPLDQRQHLPAQVRQFAPVLVDEGQQHLPAGLSGLAVLAHRIDDPEAVLGADRARDSESGVPAHRVAGHRGDVKAGAVDRQEVGVGGGEDEGRGDVAARVERGAEAVGTVQLGDRGLFTLGAQLVEAPDQLGSVGMEALQVAELGLAVAAAARADDQGRLSHAPSPAPRRRSTRGSEA
jgi:hypothetical protein